MIEVVRCVFGIGVALLSLVGCGPTKAEVARATALQEAKEAEANERAGAAFVQAWRTRNRYKIGIDQLTPPSQLESLPVHPAVAIGMVGAAFGAATVGAAFSKSPNNFNLSWH